MTGRTGLPPGPGPRRRPSAAVSDAVAAERIAFLDLWRSLAVWLMLVWHCLFDLSDAGLLPAGLISAPLMDLARTLGAGSFFLISGISLRLSRNPLRRGLLILCAAGTVTVVSFLAGKPVLFGALHLLGCCAAGCGLLLKRGGRLPPLSAVPVFLLLFLFTGTLFPRLRVSAPFLFPLGLHTAAFTSWDYYPLLPWGLVYLCGVSMSGAVLRRLSPSPSLPPPLTFCGRHSLLIYLLHQPVLYGFIWCIKNS